MERTLIHNPRMFPDLLLLSCRCLHRPAEGHSGESPPCQGFPKIPEVPPLPLPALSSRAAQPPPPSPLSPCPCPIPQLHVLLPNPAPGRLGQTHPSVPAPESGSGGFCPHEWPRVQLLAVPLQFLLSRAAVWVLQAAQIPFPASQIPSSLSSPGLSIPHPLPRLF